MKKLKKNNLYYVMILKYSLVKYNGFYYSKIII